MSKTHVPTRGSPAYVEMQALLAKKETLTTSEAAIYLGLSIHTIYKLLAEKAFPFSKPNFKRIYIMRDDLDEWRMLNQSNKLTIRKHVNNHFLKRI
jgi:excisionase family DNA binding protein